MKTVRYVSYGRVQGVGYRWFVVRTARQLRIKGQVRNLPDGAVETIAHGPDMELESLKRALREGPPAARVERVETFTENNDRYTFTTFDVVY